MKAIKSLIPGLFLFLMVSPVWSGYSLPIDTGYVWSVVQEDISYFGGYNAWTHVYKLEGDTIINDTIYQQIYRLSDSTSNNWSLYYFYMRQDSARVFLRESNGEEHLIYDFGMETGDTIHNWMHQVPWQVVEVDSAYIEDKWRKQLHLEDYYYSDITDTWIEGIGSTFGVLTPGNIFLNLSSFLLCVHRDDHLVYQKPDYTSCWIYADIESIPAEAEVKVYPNPANEILRISASSDLPDRFSIYSTTGILCFEGELIDDTINISCLKPGLYFLELIYHSGGIATLIIEKLPE